MMGACSRGKTELKQTAELSKAIIPTPEITILADLPDSNKPMQNFIKKHPVFTTICTTCYPLS
jgi:hypothetical protein